MAKMSSMTRVKVSNLGAWRLEVVNVELPSQMLTQWRKMSEQDLENVVHEELSRTWMQMMEEQPTDGLEGRMDLDVVVDD